MCNKLIVLCVALVVAGFCLPASAAYIGFDNDGNSGVNPLRVDVDGGGTSSPKDGWQGWLFTRSWIGPVVQSFTNPEAYSPGQLPVAQLEVYRNNQSPSGEGISYNRSGGWAGVDDTSWGPPEIGFGMNYVKLTLTGLQPETSYKFYLWSYEKRNLWAASSSNPDSKYGVWSTTNPKQWLDENGYGNGGIGAPKGGYYPITPVPNPPTGASGMPAGLAELVTEQGGRASLIAEDWNDHLGQLQNYVSFYAPTDSEGAITIYGWVDPTDWIGRHYMPLNGFMVIPEPATIAFLALGGLALLRKRRR